MKIRVSTDQIQQNIYEMRNLSNQMEHLLRESKTLLEKAHSMLDSPISEQYTSTGLEQVQACMQLVQTMNQCADFWSIAAQQYEACEESIANDIASQLFG